MIKKLLILGGTAEAVDLARLVSSALAGKATAITSLAGRLAPRQDIPGQTRTGGFGGAEGLRDYLMNESIDMVIDATHPFAEIISANAYDACLAAGKPRLSLIRPPWLLPSHVKWLEMDDLKAAAAILPRISRRVFMTIGRRGLDAFSAVKEVWFLVRLAAMPEGPLPLARYQLIIAGRPPYAEASELALIKDHRIDALITKQSGGKASEAKITAAMEAGVNIIFIKRPPPEPGEIAETAEQALAWIVRSL